LIPGARPAQLEDLAELKALTELELKILDRRQRAKDILLACMAGHDHRNAFPRAEIADLRLDRLRAAILYFDHVIEQIEVCDVRAGKSGNGQAWISGKVPVAEDFGILASRDDTGRRYLIASRPAGCGPRHASRRRYCILSLHVLY
jgi:hypothetical protein